MPSSTSRLTFQSAVTSEICESLSALDSASVEMVCETPKSTHQSRNPGFRTGHPLARQKSSAKGRRNVNRPQTLMYSSRAWPRRFMAVLRRTLKSAEASARITHTAASRHERDLDRRAVAVGGERVRDGVERKAVSDERGALHRAPGEE